MSERVKRYDVKRRTRRTQKDHAIDNLPEILRKVPGIGVVLIGNAQRVIGEGYRLSGRGTV